MRSLVPIVAVLSIGCMAAGEPIAPDIEPTAPTADTGFPPAPEHAWLSIAGHLALEDEGVVGGDLTVELLAPGATGDLEVQCASASSILDAPSTAPPQDDDVPYGFWTLPIDTQGCSNLPSTLELGIGRLPSILWPDADRMGVSKRHTRGLYSRSGDDLVVFGFAGTATQRAGEGTPPTLNPLPDGDYLLDTIYLLPL